MRNVWGGDLQHRDINRSKTSIGVTPAAFLRPLDAKFVSTFKIDGSLLLLLFLPNLFRNSNRDFVVAKKPDLPDVITTPPQSIDGVSLIVIYQSLQAAHRPYGGFVSFHIAVSLFPDAWGGFA